MLSTYGTVLIASISCFYILYCAICFVCCCTRKKPTDTLETYPSSLSINETRNGNVTGNGTRTITGNGNRTIRRVHFEEFDFPVSSIQPIIPRVTIPSDSNRRLLRVFEGPNLSNQFLNETQHNLILSSYAHTRTNNVIPTISRPTFDNFSLQRQTSLPSYDQVIKQPKTQETPPPMYDEIANCELRRIFRSHARTSHV